jgi:ATP-dependent DNA helicase RecQ
VERQFADGASALALLHSAGLLDWQGPFNYIIHQGTRLQFPVKLPAVGQMTQYLTTKQCRWQFLLNAFGFSKEAASLGCGHCDRCSNR